MDLNNKQRLVDKFDAYVATFEENGELPPMMKLKLHHSMRVADNSKVIVNDLGWQGTEENIAYIIGLYHDIGRFLQWQKYQTFSDPQSVDHGELGVSVLHDEKLLQLLPFNEQELIFHSIQFHNKKELPDNLQGEKIDHLKVIREADRLDILYVILNSIETGEIKKHPEIIWGAAYDDPATETVLATFEKNEPINYLTLASLTDWMLLHMQWICWFEYEGSKKLVKKQQLVERFKAVAPCMNRRLEKCFTHTLNQLQ